MGRSDSPAWYVLRTKPRADAMVAAHLGRKQIEVYFPKLAVGPAKREAPRSEATEPLFPGYLFARLALAAQFQLAAWAPGVRNFLSFGDGPAEPVDDAVVDCLRERAQGGDLFRSRSTFRSGDQVEIKIGPLAGLLAVIDRPIPASGRIKVLLEILRRQTRVELPAFAVARL